MTFLELFISRGRRNYFFFFFFFFAMGFLFLKKIQQIVDQLFAFVISFFHFGELCQVWISKIFTKI